MDNNGKIFVVQQGAMSYSNVDEVTYVFLNEADARVKHAYLLENRVVDCDTYDKTWASLHAVTPGDEVSQDNKIA